MSLSTEEIKPYWPTLSENDRMKWATCSALKELIQTDPDFRKKFADEIANSVSEEIAAI